MKKRILINILLCLILTACGDSSIIQENDNSEEEKQNIIELENEDSKIPETSDADIDTTINVDYLKTDTVLDSKQQLELLTVNFDKWNEDMDGFNNKYTEMAVADLNRNGRLEIIVSNILGTGCFSKTAVYEVDETYNSVNRMIPGDGNDYDYMGDFINAEAISCYKKDDNFYYEIEDYNSSGCDYKTCNHYWYTFDEEVCNGLIAGYYVSQGMYPEESNIIYVCFYDDISEIISENDYNNKLASFWDGYEKQANIKLQWVAFPGQDNCMTTLLDSFEGYDQEYSQDDISRLNYKNIFGESYDYVVKTD